MAIPTMQDDLDIISGLGDNPNTDNNLSEEQLKAKFDEGPNIIKLFINNVIVPAINQLNGAIGFKGTHGELSGRDAENQHPIGAIAGLEEALNNKSASDHNHDGTYAAKDHNHDENYAAKDHNHDSTYVKTEGGAMTGALTLNGIILTEGVDYGDALPEEAVKGKLFFLKE